MTGILLQNGITLRAVSYRVPSSSEPGREYTPTVTEAGWACQCKGWHYRGRCRHIEAARAGRYVGKPTVRISLPPQPAPPVPAPVSAGNPADILYA